MPDTITIHATAVALDGVGVLLRGPSGSGKSDLALRLIDGGARLIADDQTVIVRRGDRLFAAAPAAIAGRLEVRGLGIVALEPVVDVALGAVFDLVAPSAIERLPEPTTVALLDVALPRFQIAPAAPSAAAKVRLAVRQLRGDKMAPP